MKRVCLSFFLFCLAFPAAVAEAREAVETAPTFQSIGLYWKVPNGGAPCTVRYRVNPGVERPGPWQEGLDLWFDDRTGDNDTDYAGPPWRQLEYRGSLVGLSPGTRYEIELSIVGGASATVFETTWSEAFPEADVPHYIDSPISISQGGAADAYEVYLPAGGPITAPNVSGSIGIYVDAPYVIIRGITLLGGEHGIVVGQNAHHVVIEACDISDWGTPTAISGWGDECAGILIDNGWVESYPDPESALASRSIHHVVIQRNRIHHPRWDSNCWCEYNRDNEWDPWHPLGPLGILVFNPLGNNVIRYNEIYSETGRYFVDGIGGGSNYSFFGCPGRDSDIYGNRISQVWDDAIEAEGGNDNVRIWGNYIDSTTVGIATAATATGPLYVWRNIMDRSDKYDSDAVPLIVATAEKNACWKEDWMRPVVNAGRFLKNTSKEVDGKFWGSGRVYLLHNTLLQRPNDPMDDDWQWDPWPYEKIDQGVSFGLNTCKLSNFVVRNNLLQVVEKNWYSLGIPSAEASASEGLLPSDADYDMLNGTMRVYLADCDSPAELQETNDLWETNGLYSLPDQEVMPVYHDLAIPGPGEAGNFWLAPGGPGHDAGASIPGFNDGPLHTGAAPDMGAHEYGTALVEFGVDAYLCPDADEDGHRDGACGGTDCDDTDPLVNPDAIEDCATAIDDDCDGEVNEDCPSTCFAITSFRFNFPIVK